ncbi:hypothetical protein [Moorena sp. SIO4G3]|uniref:hypothetical protein n=1 Tax=Moorena sp. SIO4G3 TaxID=2607821 RepID=UPI00142A38E7|nr:hypothetical protein [Moorena sp. SIO4G3]NEO80700.1 hypothetical protein [Moorena sp. SIO4G3]
MVTLRERDRIHNLYPDFPIPDSRFPIPDSRLPYKQELTHLTPHPFPITLVAEQRLHHANFECDVG